MMEHQFKIIVEQHADGFVAYPQRHTCLCGMRLGLRGVVVGEGDSYEEALADVTSAIAFHIESFGADALENV